ncbi:oligosaccharide flippase family protein [Dietzia sp. DQ11-44]|nr:oligosaccharide flippase family protein [Dietzia sp. Cai40]MBB1043943.1 oligosaccharide flippase family protein [Dietzia sp. DQ11-44]
MFRTSALTIVVSLALALVSLVNASVTARALGVEGRGLLASALLVVALAQGLGLLGLGQAFVFHGRNDRLLGDGRRHLSAALGLVLLLGCLVAAVLVPFGPLVTVAVIASITVTLGGIATGFDLLVACARFEPTLRLFNWLRALGPTLATLSIVLVWAFVPLDVTVVLALQTASTLIAGFVGFLALRRMLGGSLQSPSTGGLSVPEFLRSGLGYQGINATGLFLAQAHMFVVMSVGSLAGFGLYSAAYGLSRMVSPIQASIGNVVFAHSVGSAESGRGEAAMRALRITFLPLLILAGLIAAVSPWLVQLLLGREFAAAARPFTILTIEAVVAGAAFILGQHLQAVGRVRAVLAVSALSMIPILMAAVTLDEGNVVVGMAWLMLLASSLRLIATLLVYRKQFGVAVWRVFPSGADCRLVLDLLKRAR